MVHVGQFFMHHKSYSDGYDNVEKYNESLFKGNFDRPWIVVYPSFK